MRRALALLALLDLGCGSTYVQRYLLDRPGPPHNGHVRVVLSEQRAPAAGAVALVQVVSRGPDADLPHLIQALREEAQRLGCTAVVQVRVARAISTATAVGFAVRRDVPTAAAQERRDAPWSPPPPIADAGTPPPTTANPAESAAPPPWSAP